MLADISRNLIGLLRTKRAHHAAVVRLRPMILASQSRIGPVPRILWRHPYAVGLLSMSITLIALHASRRISSEDLAAVQVAAWQDISGCCDCDIGEQIVLLSSARDIDFVAGCTCALRMFARDPRGASNLEHAETGPHLGLLHGNDYATGSFESALSQAWEDCFDSRIAALTAQLV